jgi:multicomponent K+:H+ antiporter subunit G
MIDLALDFAFGCIGLALVMCTWRLIKGPEAPDRVLALDTLYVNVVALVILLGMRLQTALLFEAALLIALLGFAGTVALVGAVGMLRFPDFFMRLHAPTKATTLGVGGVLLASMLLSAAMGSLGVHELLITLFLFVTAPISANLMAKAAIHLRSPSKAGPAPLDGP